MFSKSKKLYKRWLKSPIKIGMIEPINTNTGG